jgi:hypothetical protein
MFTLERISTLDPDKFEAYVQHDGARTHKHPLLITRNHPVFDPKIGLHVPRILETGRITVREVAVEDTDQDIIHTVLYTDPFSDT